MSNILDKFKEAPAENKVRDMSKKVKVGIIGTGWIAEAHVKAYQKCEDVEIVALADLAELGRDNPLYAELAKIVEANNGMWCSEAEKYLLANAKPI